MHSEAAWSLLDAKPVTLYLKELDAHIVYWNGFGTTRSHALMVVGTIWNNIWATPLMKNRAWEEFLRVYRSNGFKTRKWDQLVDSFTADGYMHYVIHSIRKHGNYYDLKTRFNPREALDWFHPSRELCI